MDDLRRKLKLKLRARLAAESEPEPAPQRRARKKVMKKGAKPRRGYDDEPGGDRPDPLQGEPSEEAPTLLATPEEDGVEDADVRPDPPRRGRARATDNSEPFRYRAGLSAKERAETARGFYVCLACQVISYVGFGWRRNPPCRDCGGRTTVTTRGHCEDHQGRITM